MRAAAALWAIDQKSSKVLPVLLELLKDKDLRWATINLLGSLGPEAKPAVPALTKLLADEASFVRKAAGEALVAIDPDAARKAGVHSELYRDFPTPRAIVVPTDR